MGKVEKIVVLSVLFLIAVILAVSLDSGGDGESRAGGRSGLDDEQQAHLDRNTGDRTDRLSAPLDIPGEEPGPAREELSSGLTTGLTTGAENRRLTPDPVTPRPEEGTRRNPSGGLLNAAVTTDGTRRALSSEPLAPVEPIERESDIAPASVGDLVSVAGLEATPSADLMAYTCLDGDTFKKAAARFYGDGSKAELLRRYNEGVRDLRAGHVLFVPVHDDGYGSVEEYEVLEGESLWVVAKKVYGKGHLWSEIWEANKDRLKSPDAVRAGVVLRIP